MIRVLVLLAVVAWPGVAGAAILTLTERQQQEAMQTGERSVTAESFGEEWRVAGSGGEMTTVLTPFHRLT